METIINIDSNIQIRWVSLEINDIQKTIKVDYQIEQKIGNTTNILNRKNYLIEGAEFEAWDAQLGSVIRGAISNGITQRET